MTATSKSPKSISPVYVERLLGLRDLLKTADSGKPVAAYIIPSEDPHMSEYCPECYKRREAISGFTGSAGIVVVTSDAALLWTDGRYFVQAEAELSPEWTLMRSGTTGVPSMEDWLAKNLPEGSKVAIDPELHTVNSTRTLQKKLESSMKELVLLGPETKGVQASSHNLVDQVWGSNRPAPPSAALRVHPIGFAGHGVRAKVASLRHQLISHLRDDANAAPSAAAAAAAAAAPIPHLLVSTLDEVAWLTNLRGSDVECSPVFLSYAIVHGRSGGSETKREGESEEDRKARVKREKEMAWTAEEEAKLYEEGESDDDLTVTLYVDLAKVAGAEVQAHLKREGIQVKSLGSITADLSTLAATSGSKSDVVFVDPARASAALLNTLSNKKKDSTRKRAREEDEETAPAPSPSTATAAAPSPPVSSVVKELTSPIVLAKALKNPAELQGMKEAHLRDAVAMAQFLSFLEKEIKGGRVFNEHEIHVELTARRAGQSGFLEPSFPTIAGADSNGAIIHYRAPVEGCASVSSETMLLLDSGAQFDCGTTDITRTMHFGTPSSHQRSCYTRVLQGHIALDRCIFPPGTIGSILDVLARTHLWRAGLNYLHGTGHGVGAALCVHEGPQSISSRLSPTATPLKKGMVVSNEPGYYETGAFGIRIENLITVVEKDTPFKFQNETYLGFEPLTLVPIQLKMVDPNMLSKDEIEWIDQYHATVYDKVASRLPAEDDVAQEWLRRNTRPLAEQLQA